MIAQAERERIIALIQREVVPAHRLYGTGGCGSLRGQGYGSIGEVSGNDYRTSEC